MPDPPADQQSDYGRAEDDRRQQARQRGGAELEEDHAVAAPIASHGSGPGSAEIAASCWMMLRVRSIATGLNPPRSGGVSVVEEADQEQEGGEDCDDRTHLHRLRELALSTVGEQQHVAEDDA